MNRRLQFLFLLLSLVLTTKVSAQGTAFSYQGRLGDNGSPANGIYDFRFGIFNAVTNGTRVSGWLTNSSVPVSNGLFIVTLDFGPGIFTGGNSWLDVAVQTNGGGSFSALAPRQPVLPVPYAIFSTGASNVLGTVPAAQVSGASTNQVTFTNVNNTFGGTFNGTFSGNGAAVTNLNGSQIAFGIVADARLSTNVALLNTNQTFTGTNTFTGNNLFTSSNNFTGNNQFTGANNFTNTGNRFTGSFFGNGNVGWDAFAGPSVQAQFNHGYLLTNSQPVTVTLPLTPASSEGTNVGYIVRISGAGAGGWQIAGNAGQSFIGNFSSYRNSPLQATAVGVNWRRLASSTDGSRMYASGNLLNGVYVSFDSGHTWNSTGISGTALFFVACSADGMVVYAAINGGEIQRSLDGGATWGTYQAGNTAWTVIACSANGSNAIAGGTNSALALSTGTSPATGNWTAVACSANFTNLAAAKGSTIYTSTNGGVNWINTTPSGVCNALVASASGSKLVAACNGGVITSTNFGATWATSSSGAGNWTALAASSDCTRILAGASNGLFYASANFGANWTTLSSTNQFWAGAACTADGTTFIANTRTVQSITGSIYYSTAGQLVGGTTTNNITGSRGNAVELQYIGNGQFMPISSTGSLWAN